jgi:signal transduction histidine kinase
VRLQARLARLELRPRLELWLLVVLGIALTGRLRLPWLRLMVLLGLVHLALAYARNVELLGIVAPFLIATPIASCWYAKGRGSGRDVEWLDRLFDALAAPAPRSTAIAASLAALAMVALAIKFGTYAPAGERTPEAALNAAIEAGAQGPVLNQYSFGGYLIFRGIPVFIDGRADLYGRAFTQKYFDGLALRDGTSLSRILDEFRIGWTLLEPGTPAIAMLDIMPCWRRVYADKVAVVHMRAKCTVAP